MRKQKSFKLFRLPCILFCAVLIAGCSDPDQQPLNIEADADQYGSTPASSYTTAMNARVLEQLPFADQQDFIEANRGLIATEKNLVIAGLDGVPAWNRNAYDFIQGEAPASVNPSLWRQAKLNNIHGLFKVSDGIYQIRGFDLANMTIIEGEQGWIVVDPMTNAETAASALAFARRHLGNKPVSAMLFTHSHIDHFGGALAMLAEGQEAPRVIVPAGFMDEATSENLLAGPTMTRRAAYMYGFALPRTPRGHVDTGLGKEPSRGTHGILQPSDVVTKTGDRLTIDGVDFVFQIVSGSEAPAEFTFYLPAHRAYCGAELLSRNMHNLYTLRGAKVRDALAWSAFIDESNELFAEAEIYFASHHWPIWGNERIDEFMQVHSDTYKYIHDQTLRLAYQGYTPSEIAEELELPESLQKGFSNRGYYGTLKHNSRAVYQAYFGWYDGNPAHLDPLPNVPLAKHYVAAMGGAQNVLQQAQQAYDQGQYRWVATLLNHLVFAEPSNREARALLARNYDQLGYQAESGPWRDVYLSGAFELRNGRSEQTIEPAAMRNMIKYAPREKFFDVMAAKLNGPAAAGAEMVINFTFTDLQETFVLRLQNSVLHHRKGEADSNANASINMTHELFLDMALGKASLTDLLLSEQLSTEGSKLDLAKFFSLQDDVDGLFNIVTP